MRTFNPNNDKESYNLKKNDIVKSINDLENIYAWINASSFKKHF